MTLEKEQNGDDRRSASIIGLFQKNQAARHQRSLLGSAHGNKPTDTNPEQCERSKVVTMAVFAIEE